MAVFSSSEDMYGVFTPFLQRLASDPDVGPKFSAAGIAFRVIHVDPEGVFLLDATKSPPELYVGRVALERSADVEISMSADDGHSFWLGKLVLPVAVARRKVVVTGGMTRLLGLLPALQPANRLYAQHMETLGRMPV